MGERAELRCVGLLYRVLASGERVLLQNTEVGGHHDRSSEEDPVGLVDHMQVEEDLGCDAVAPEGLLRTSVEQVVLGHKPAEEVRVARIFVHIVAVVVEEVRVVEVPVHTVVAEVLGDRVPTSYPELVEEVRPSVVDQAAAGHRVDRPDPDVVVSWHRVLAFAQEDRRVLREEPKNRVRRLDFEQNS